MNTAKIRRNTVISLFISGIEYLYPILIFVYIARILHPEGLGSIRFASSIAAYFVMLTGLGMPIYGMRAIAGSSRNTSRLTAELILIRLIAGMLSWCLFLLFSLFWRGNELLPIYGLAILFAIPECTWLYKGKEEYVSLGWISALTRLAGLALVFLLVKDASDAKSYAWISVSIPLVTYLAGIILAERKWKLNLFSNCYEIIASGKLVSSVRKHIKPLSLFLLMSFAVTIYSHTDSVMLGILENERAVGLYSCAARFKGILPTLTGALWATALPRSAELWKQQKNDEFRILSEKSFHFVYVVMIPLTAYFILFAEPWILLLGGADYLEAAGPMRLLLLAVIPIGFSNIIGGQMLIPMGQERKLFQAEAIGAVSNIILNAALIPFLSASGAAIATVVSETLVTVFAGRAVLKAVKAKVLQPGNLVRALTGCLIADTIAFVVGMLIEGAWRGPLSLAVFAAIFAGTMLLTRDEIFLELYRDLPSWIRKPVGEIRQIIREIRYRIVEKLFPGRTQFFCPCCGVRVHAFLKGSYIDFPDIYNPTRYAHTQQDVICPVCGALPRHRILARWCEENLRKLHGKEILYFAPEKCMTRWMKRNGISYTTADLYQEADLQLDIQDTGLPERSVDVIVCNHVLEHVNDFRTAIRELHRVLKQGGMLICSFPMDPEVELVEEDPEVKTESEKIQRFGQRDHLRVFGMKAERLLEEVGFQVEKISGEDFEEEILPVVGPADYDMNILFACVK